MKKKRIVKELGAIISDFAIEIDGWTSSKERYNKAHDKCLKRLVNQIEILTNNSINTPL